MDTSLAAPLHRLDPTYPENPPGGTTADGGDPTLAGLMRMIYHYCLNATRSSTNFGEGQEPGVANASPMRRRPAAKSDAGSARPVLETGAAALGLRHSASGP